MKTGEFDKALTVHLRRIVGTVEMGMGDRDNWPKLPKFLLTEINTLRRSSIEIAIKDGIIGQKEKSNG